MQRMISHDIPVIRPANRAAPVAAYTVESNPPWAAIESLQPRKLSVAGYNQLMALLAPGEVLLAQVGSFSMGGMYPKVEELAFWIANQQQYDALMSGMDERQAVYGFYAVRADQLLRLLFV